MEARVIGKARRSKRTRTEFMKDGVKEGGFPSKNLKTSRKLIRCSITLKLRWIAGA